MGTSPGFNGDTPKALRAIKAKTLMLTGTKDLLNPEFEPKEGALHPRCPAGHHLAGNGDRARSAGGAFPADVDSLNRQTADFLELITPRGK